MSRVAPHVDLTRPSPCKSSRLGAHPTLIVIHATVSHNRPGVVDLASIGEWFSHLSTQASSHVCTDNEAHSARFVADNLKAWHCAAYNRMSLGIEQILPSDGTEVTRDMLRETARWIALWSRKYTIPIRKAQVTSSGVILKPGVIRHSELGALGGGHTDPGIYDMHALLSLARFYRGKL